MRDHVVHLTRDPRPLGQPRPGSRHLGLLLQQRDVGELGPPVQPEPPGCQHDRGQQAEQEPRAGPQMSGGDRRVAGESIGRHPGPGQTRRQGQETPAVYGARIDGDREDGHGRQHEEQPGHGDLDGEGRSDHEERPGLPPVDQGRLRHQAGAHQQGRAHTRHRQHRHHRRQRQQRHSDHEGQGQVRAPRRHCGITAASPAGKTAWPRRPPGRKAASSRTRTRPSPPPRGRTGAPVLG